MGISKESIAIQKAALQCGVSEEDFRREIERALQAGMANPDPQVQAAWAKIPSKGKSPTSEEVTAYVAERVRRKNAGRI
ncbi:MAG: hypothetical protein FWF10_00250 [Clostridiales bacterium]|nr:hypothetical protein [Clostridiales bacterium]